MGGPFDGYADWLTPAATRGHDQRNVHMGQCSGKACLCSSSDVAPSAKVTCSLLQGHWLRGIIDQLELDQSGQIRVVENKTRRKPLLPLLAQQETARLQVCATSTKTCRSFGV